MSKFVAFTSLGRKALPNQFDLIALVIIFGAFAAAVSVGHDVTQKIDAPQATAITLSYWALPYYALRTTLRMFVAILASLFFTFTYATVAAKSQRAEKVLIPVLDVLQSVPVLGFLSFTVTFFLGLFPGSILGAECAAIFAIFTSQAWNMAFSFYQSLRTVPDDLIEVSRGFQLSPWQRFWQLEAPFAMPGLIWNMMMSMSGGWFFVVASEAISVGDNTINLPGIGSYLSVAIEQKNIGAVFAAVVAVLAVILLYDQLIFRPLVAFSTRFRVELLAGPQQERSWVMDTFKRTRWLRPVQKGIATAFDRFSLMRLELPGRSNAPVLRGKSANRIIDVLFYSSVGLLSAYSFWEIVRFVSRDLTWHELWLTIGLTTLTLIRVVCLIALATLFWVPIGVWIGIRPRIAEKIQPLAQFLAAFPANVIFPVAVLLIIRFSLNPDFWLSFLIILGTQWYILFNVIAGAQAFPSDLREAATSFNVRGWDWWRKVMLPGIFPYYVTGALTASGGSWNAAIVAEYVKWGNDTVTAHGIGSYIAMATKDGNFPKIVLGVAVMSVFVIVFNRCFWRPLFALGEKRLRIS
jgi:NitT/TauT family transport system permease protein